MRLETFVTPRTARLALLGPESAEVRELWYVLHGYGELAATFIANFGVIDDGTRLIVAPEALSRHYWGRIEDRIGREVPIGGSWMTKEARDHEIHDYLTYLDGLHAHITARLRGATPQVTVLGFSQGGATSSRWVASGSVPVARHVLWGSAMPPELDLETPDTPMRRAEQILVVGTRDQFATPKVVARENGRLDAAGFPYRFVQFDGGHRLDDDTLRAIAGVTSPGSAPGRDDPSSSGDPRPDPSPAPRA
jgi:predicted esterase